MINTYDGEITDASYSKNFCVNLVSEIVDFSENKNVFMKFGERLLEL